MGRALQTRHNPFIEHSFRWDAELSFSLRNVDDGWIKAAVTKEVTLSVVEATS